MASCWKKCRGIAIKNYPPGNYISPPKGTFEDYFPLPKVGYVSSLEGTVCHSQLITSHHFLFVASCYLLHLAGNCKQEPCGINTD